MNTLKTLPTTPSPKKAQLKSAKSEKSDGYVIYVCLLCFRIYALTIPRPVKMDVDEDSTHTPDEVVEATGPRFDNLHMSISTLFMQLLRQV